MFAFSDSFGGSLAVFTDGLGLLPYDNGSMTHQRTSPAAAPTAST